MLQELLAFQNRSVQAQNLDESFFFCSEESIPRCHSGNTNDRPIFDMQEQQALADRLQDPNRRNQASEGIAAPDCGSKSRQMNAWRCCKHALDLMDQMVRAGLWDVPKPLRPGIKPFKRSARADNGLGKALAGVAPKDFLRVVEKPHQICAAARLHQIL